MHNLEPLEQINGLIVSRSADNPDIVILTLPARDDEEYIVRCECAG